MGGLAGVVDRAGEGSFSGEGAAPSYPSDTPLSAGGKRATQKQDDDGSTRN